MIVIEQSGLEMTVTVLLRIRLAQQVRVACGGVGTSTEAPSGGSENSVFSLHLVFDLCAQHALAALRKNNVTHL